MQCVPRLNGEFELLRECTVFSAVLHILSQPILTKTININMECINGI